MIKIGSSRILLLTLVSLALGMNVTPANSASLGTPDDVETVLQEIAKLERRAEDGQSGDDLRSRALDDSLEARDSLLRLEETRDDPRRPIWLTDQAESLLLKRIEFPSSWSTHLMVAHPACPLLPPEIPLVVGRGLQEIIQAEEAIDAAIETVEADEAFDRDNALISLHERLLFEKQLRIPLLKAIALSLAARANPAAGREAVEILRSMRDREDLQVATKEVIDHWFRQALLTTRDRVAVRSEFETTGTEATDDRLQTLRKASLLQEYPDVVTLGRRMIRELGRDQGYEKLLLADIVEEALMMDADTPLNGEAAANWADGAGDTWIMLLDDSQREDDWTLDGPIVARLNDLAGIHGEEGAPLAVLWAVGQKELAGRSRDRVEEPDMLEKLRNAVLDARKDEPGRARALETAARIAMLEDERLIAAELCEILYREHPRHPFGGPRLVADLTEPWARAGQDEATRRYETALELLISDPAFKDERNDAGTQTLRLAEQHLRRKRPEKSRTLLEGFRPGTKEEAARYLDICLREIALIRTLETLSDQMVDLEYDLLLMTVDRVLGEFGPVDAGIQAAASRARIASLSERKRLTSDTLSIGIVERISEREDIPPEIRIDALFLRHKMKVSRNSERRDALENMPELMRAIELDSELAASALVLALEEGLSRLEAIGYLETQQGDQDRSIEEIRSLVGLIDARLLSSLSMTQKVVVGRSFNRIEATRRAIPLWREMAARQPDAWVVMQGYADALGLSDEITDLAEAMRLYRRLGQGGPGDNVPEDVWWNAQLGQLLMMEKARRSTEKIPTRIQRLKLIDPALGGQPFESKFESLLQRMTQKS